MPRTFALDWRAIALRGAVAIIFGIIAFFMPIVTLFAVTLLFGAYALIDGLVNLMAAMRSRSYGQHWLEFLLEGIIGLAVAVITVAWPAITLAMLIYVIAAWAIVTGVLEIVAAIRLRRQIKREWLLVLAGSASLVFGVLLFAAPGPGALVLAWWIGGYIFAFGVLMLGLALRLRRLFKTDLKPGHV
jgi:uncharacterized membrane protein HdeD (DUF308 family)